MNDDQISLFKKSSLEDRSRIMKKWRSLITRELRAFTRRGIKATKYKKLKSSGRYFGIKANKKGDEIRIFGTKPNAGLLYGFSAPINERVQSSTPFKIRTISGWRMTRKRQKYSDSLGSGIDPANVPYLGTGARPDGAYFGIMKNAKPLAYGFVGDNLALPVYSDEGIADWLMIEHHQEVDSLVQACGELAIESVLQGKD